MDQESKLIDRISEDVKSVMSEQVNHPLLYVKEVPFKEAYIKISATLYKAFQLLEDLEGETFTSLSGEEKRKKIYQITEEDQKVEKTKGRKFLERILDSDYKRFHNGVRGGWGQFVADFSRFGGSFKRSIFPRPEVSFHTVSFPGVESTTWINLPHLSWIGHNGYENSPDDRETAIFNTNLQTKLAKSLDILKDQERWEDFLHREEIVPFYGYISDVNEMVAVQPGIIPGLKSVRSYGLYKDHTFDFEGMPYLYFSVPTKYPGITAAIQFTYPIDRSRPFDQLLQSGKSTPKIILQIPTEAFFDSV